MPTIPLSEIPKLLSVHEFAIRAGVSEAAVYKRIRLQQLTPIDVHNHTKPGARFMLYESDLAEFTRSPRKSRRTITVSPALSKAIDTHLQDYGNISRLLEDGAWMVLYLNGIVDLSTAVENVSAVNVELLVKLSSPPLQLVRKKTTMPRFEKKLLDATEGEGYILPDYGTCKAHGWFDWRAYMDEDEAVSDMKEFGWIECPICLAEIVGIGN